MTWSAVGRIYLVLAALVALVVFLDRGREEVATAPDPTARERSLLGVDATAIDGLSLRRRGAVVRAVREAERWHVLEPAAAQVPSDLVAATVATLTAGQVSEVMVANAGAQFAAFGLNAPTAELEVVIRGETPRTVRVILGANNPTNTAIYAKRDDEGAVFLVGLNLRYYTDLIFQAAGFAR